MRFKQWIENASQRGMWWKKKSKHHKDHAHTPRGQIAGNVRYSGKGGYGSTQQPNKFRTKDHGNDNQLR